MSSNFRQHYQVMDHSKITKMHFWMIQRAKKDVLGHFVEFGLLDWLDIAYCASTKCLPTFSTIRIRNAHGRFSGKNPDHSKITNMYFWMIQLSIGHFLKIGWSDQLDIAYCDSTKCFLTFYNVTRSCRIIQKSKDAFLNDPKSQKRGFWSFSGVWSVGSTWYCILWWY